MTGFLFTVVFLLAAPFWALMILAPGWRWTRRIVASPWIVAPPVVVYAVLAVPNLDVLGPVVTAPTLDGLREAMAVPAAAAAGWAHFIAFDLFVGRWMYLDGRDRGMHPLLMAPLLILTILLGPLGLLGYLAVRSLHPGRAAATVTADSAGAPDARRRA